MEPEEVAEAFEILSSAGKVRAFGVSNQRPSQIELLKSCVKQDLIINQLQFSLPVSNMIASGMEVNMETPGSVDHDGSAAENFLELLLTYGGAAGSFAGGCLQYSAVGIPQGGALLVAAWFDGDGRMLGVKLASLPKGDSLNRSLDIGNAGADTASCRMLLLNKTSFVPLCPLHEAVKADAALPGPIEPVEK